MSILADKFPEFDSSNSQLTMWMNDCLAKAPDYFWTLPASTSGKYHHDSDNNEGGTVSHTRKMIVTAKELRDVFLLDNKEFDLVQAAIILHDTFKCGFEGRENKYAGSGKLGTDILHTVYPRIGFAKVVVGSDITDDDVDLVYELVEGHYGKWSPIPQCYPTDFKNLDRREQLKVFVHMCDMICSRKSFDVKL
jgi:23S rRNA maturation-related 3'-5' exoribonuclease YhaM